MFNFQCPQPLTPYPDLAFMLYRQHFQAAVVARNPGLANPEISKIIGKQWREEDQNVKDTWDDLAEVESSPDLLVVILPLTSSSEREDSPSPAVPQLQVPAAS